MNTFDSKSMHASDIIVAVTANFTAEPLRHSLMFWAARLGLGSLHIAFSGYNQVFQDLTRDDSALASGDLGVNCILIRLEDWARDQESDLRVKTITASAQDFIRHFDAFTQRARRPTILVICPPSHQTSSDRDLLDLCQSLGAEIRRSAESLRGVSVITAEEIVEHYPVESIDDPEGDRQGHVPFTNAYWTAIGTMVCRRTRTLMQPPYKVIVVDADNTLWDGVVGEVGAEQVQISGGRRTFHQFLHACKRRGMLLALISKNKEADVAEVFQRSDMILRFEDFVAWKVNWEPKSHNLRTLASDLDLGLDSFVFLDDNPTECAEVMGNCPSVAVVCVPPTAEALPEFIRHVWAFDLPPATTADTGRTEQYRQQAERNSFRRSAGSFREFIESLELQVQVFPLRTEHLERAAQLTQRTNQFNTTGRRRTVPELAACLGSVSRGALGVRVRDRFGDYGEVGLCTFTETDGAVHVENFLLSCRVLGKGVEHRMLAALGRLAMERGHAELIVPFIQTERNEPAAKFLQAVAGRYWTGQSYNIPAREAAETLFEPVEAREPAVADDPAAGSNIAPARRLCDFGEIAARLSNIADIEAAVRKHHGTRRPEMAIEYMAPRDRAETMLAETWAIVLGLDRVGIHDNFFDLGGDSVLAIQVISKASQAGISHTLRQLFEFPTVAELVSMVRVADTNVLKAEDSHAVPQPAAEDGGTAQQFPLARLGRLSLEDVVARLDKSRR
jgi:FkbH-like protein